jgi:predicted Zn-dependent protease
MAGRAKALMSTRVEDIENLTKSYEAEQQTTEKNPQRQAMVTYAAAMGYAKQRSMDKARLAAQSLVPLVADDPVGLREVKWLLADIERQAGNPNGCLNGLRDQHKQRAWVLLRAQCQLATKDIAMARSATENIQLRLAQFPRDPLAWDMVAQAYEHIGQPLQAIRADAESRAVRWDEVAAIDRLRAGQELAKRLTQQGKMDLAAQQEANIIDSRLRALESIRLELLRPQP